MVLILLPFRLWMNIGTFTYCPELTESTPKSTIKFSYYQYYGYWGGWDWSSLQRIKDIDTHKNLKNRPMLAGETFHQCVRHTFTNLRSGFLICLSFIMPGS